MDVSRCWLEELAPQPLGLSRGLVDDRAPVDDIHKAPRQLWVLGEREEPKGDDARLPEAGRQIACLGEVVRDEALVQRALPREGWIAGEQREIVVKGHAVTLSVKCLLFRHGRASRGARPSA